jgi:hypothetical protein
MRESGAGREDFLAKKIVRKKPARLLPISGKARCVLSFNLGPG